MPAVVAEAEWNALPSIIDCKIGFVGSLHLDLRSSDLTYENNVLFQDEETTAAIFGRQEDYISRSDIVDVPEVLAWPYNRRIWNNVISTIGPIL